MARNKHQKLSNIQIRTIIFIQKFTDQHGYAPNYREIKDQVGYSSTSMVHYNIERLVELGYIARDPKISRSLRVIKPVPVVDGLQAAASIIQRKAQELFSIPIIGRIVASQPVPVPSSDFNYFDAEETVEIPPSLLQGHLKNSDRLFALQVKGDSMIEDMVNDGDIVILQPVQEARDGDMVAVWLPDEEGTTLKRFYRQKDHIRLQPANPNMEPIIIPKTRPIEIQGKVLLTISPK